MARLNIDPSAAREARRRFTSHFGPLNQKIHVRNHTFVMLDAAGLVEEDYLRAAKYIDYDRWTPMPHGPVEFVHSLREGTSCTQRRLGNDITIRLVTFFRRRTVSDHPIYAHPTPSPGDGLLRTTPRERDDSPRCRAQLSEHAR